MPFKAPSSLTNAVDLLFPGTPHEIRDFLASDPQPVGVALTLLQGLEKVFPELASCRDPLNIVLAGATEAEVSAKIALHRDVTARLSLPDIRLALVGLDLPEDIDAFMVVAGTPRLLDRKTLEEDFHSTLLAHFHDRGHLPRPDLICIFHPGIQYNLDLWLRDTGLRDFVKEGVPVLLSAYRLAEARADRAMLEAVGYQLSDLVENPAAPVVPRSTHPESERFGHYLYSITGIESDRWHRPNTEKLAPYQSHVAYAEASSNDPQVLRKLHRREVITTKGTFDERQQEALCFDRVVEDIGHSPYHLRRLIASPESAKHRNDDYAAAYLIISTLDSEYDEIDQFLAKHPNAIHAVDGYGRSPLHIAAAESLPHMVEHLVEAGFDINKLSDAGETPLSCAAMGRAGDCADVLLEVGARRSLGSQAMPEVLLEYYLSKVDEPFSTA